MYTNDQEPERLDIKATQLTAEAARQKGSTVVEEQPGKGPIAKESAAESPLANLQLADVLNAIQDRISLKDATGKISFANQAFLDFYNLTLEQVVGKPHRSFLPEEMLSICTTTDQAVLEHGESICLETQWQEKNSEDHYWSETQKSPIKNADGEIIGIVGVSRDITERRSAEEELKRQKQLLELIVETVPDWIFVKDNNREILLANRAFYENSNLSPIMTIGCDPAQCFPDDLRKVSEESDARVLESGEPLCREVITTAFDGSEKHLEVRKLPLIEDGQVTGIVGVCRDLTETKKNELQAKRNEAMLLHASRLSSLGELAASIAHEVNQPLFSILNYAKAVENRLQDEENLDLETIREWVQQIYKEASRGGKIVRRIKSFVQPAETARESSEINLLVQESIEFLSFELQEVGATIKTELTEGLPELHVDRIQIQQVLVNLLKNAIEACSEQSKKKAHLIISTQQKEAGTVEVSVTDNGPGLSTSEEINLLNPFQTTKPDGIGLGLAISNTIIEAHQGKMDYQSNEAGGMTFSFTLPTESK